MADLAQRVKDGLNETRIAVLVGQVLFAYAFQAAFQKRFPELPDSARWAQLAAATLIPICLAFLMMPAAFHRIVEGGRDSEGFCRMLTALMTIVLPMFAAALALEIFAMTSAVLPPAGAGAMAGAAFALALTFWYGLEALERRRRRG